MDGKKVLITGGFGYLGSYLTRYLLGQGWTVYRGTRSANIWDDGLTAAHGVSMAYDDSQQLRDACQGMDVVINLAGPDQKFCIKNPDAARSFYTSAARKLLESAATAGVSRVMFFSTIHIYGTPMLGHLHEEKSPDPQHPYARFNLAREEICKEFQDEFASLVVFRLSNGFGCPVHPEISQWGLVAIDLCRRAATLGRVAMTSPGDMLRDFITLEDIVRATQHMLTLPPTRTNDMIFNLGGNYTESVIGMAQRVAKVYKELTGQSIPVTKPEGGNYLTRDQLIFDTKRLAALGYTPLRNIDETLAETITFCLKHFAR